MSGSSVGTILTHYVIVPPDGGWGIVVVAVCFVLNFIIDGVIYTFGIFIDDISADLQVHPTQVAVANSLMGGFYYLTGPLTCALANRFGFRVVGIVGCFLSAGVLAGASYLNNLIAFLIIAGCFGGITFNMIYASCMLIVSFYFAKWRALATAISVTGTSLGIIAFPPIFKTYLADLTWRWKFRILSAVCAGSSVLVLTFRPIEPTKVVQRRSSVKSGFSRVVEDDEPERDQDDDDGGIFGNIRWVFRKLHNVIYPTIIPEGDEYSQNKSTYVMFPDETTSRKGVSFAASRVASIEFFKPSYSEDSLDFQPVCCGSCWCCRCCSRSKCCRRTKCCKCCKCCKCIPRILQENIPSRPMYRDDIFYSGPITTLAEYERSRTFAVSVVSPTPYKPRSSLSYHLVVTRTSSTKDLEDELQQRTGCCRCHEALLRVLVTMLDLKLLKSPSLVLLLLSGFFTMIGLFIPFCFMTQRGVEIGLDETWSTLLLTSVGIANTVGRVVCGSLSCCPSLNLTVISWVTLLIAGGVTVGSLYLTTLYEQLAFTVVFGFTIASFTALRSVVLANMVGLENLTNAFGLNILFYGIGGFIGVPVAGVIQNYTGMYGYCFVFAGGALIVSGILLMPVERIAKNERDKKKRKKKVGFAVK